MIKPRRIRITHIYRSDAFYDTKDKWIGKEGDFYPDPKEEQITKGYYSGGFYINSHRYYFLGIRYIRV